MVDAILAFDTCMTVVCGTKCEAPLGRVKRITLSAAEESLQEFSLKFARFFPLEKSCKTRGKSYCSGHMTLP